MTTSSNGSIFGVASLLWGEFIDEFPVQRAKNDEIPSQRASNAENASTWWRNYVFTVMRIESTWQRFRPAPSVRCEPSPGSVLNSTVATGTTATGTVPDSSVATGTATPGSASNSTVATGTISASCRSLPTTRPTAIQRTWGTLKTRRVGHYPFIPAGTHLVPKTS